MDSRRSSMDERASLDLPQPSRFSTDSQRPSLDGHQVHLPQLEEVEPACSRQKLSWLMPGALLLSCPLVKRGLMVLRSTHTKGRYEHKVKVQSLCRPGTTRGLTATGGGGAARIPALPRHPRGSERGPVRWEALTQSMHGAHAACRTPWPWRHLGTSPSRNIPTRAVGQRQGTAIFKRELRPPGGRKRPGGPTTGMPGQPGGRAARAAQARRGHCSGAPGRGHPRVALDSPDGASARLLQRR